jgi:hypothetical protein
VKLIGSENDQFQFQLAFREQEVLAQVLRLYPQIPASSQPLSKTAGLEESNQRLLDEALAESRSQNKRELDALLADPRRFSQQDTGWRLVLSAEDVERLLQILNDIRIGSWIRLGSPEVPLSALTPESAPHFWAMEMAGSFQMHFLELLEG